MPDVWGPPTTGREGGDPPAVPPHRVRLPVNLHRWSDISFLHFPFDPAAVAPLVPDSLQVLTFEGRAWVSVTPFRMEVRPPGIGGPLRWAFPETNVRTYVTSADGREGLWFLHMEVTAAWFVAVLRALGLPYVRRRMSIAAEGGRFTYRSSPGARTGGHHIVVRPGLQIRAEEESRRDRFLTARWAAYHRRGPLLLRTPVEHPRWPLQTARADAAELDGLWRAAGLPDPLTEPLVHYSPGVTVRVGPPSLVR